MRGETLTVKDTNKMVPMDLKVLLNLKVWNYMKNDDTHDDSKFYLSKMAPRMRSSVKDWYYSLLHLFKFFCDVVYFKIEIQNAINTESTHTGWPAYLGFPGFVNHYFNLVKFYNNVRRFVMFFKK